MNLLSSKKLIRQFPDSIVWCGARLSVSLWGPSGAVPVSGAVSKEVVPARAGDRAEGFDAEGVRVEDAAVVDLGGDPAVRFNLLPEQGRIGTVVHEKDLNIYNL